LEATSKVGLNPTVQAFVVLGIPIIATFEFPKRDPRGKPLGLCELPNIIPRSKTVMFRNWSQNLAHQIDDGFHIVKRCMRVKFLALKTGKF
jgi:hypothetical protein